MIASKTILEHTIVHSESTTANATATLRAARHGIVEKAAAEALATFGFVFAGTAALVVDDVTHGSLTHVGVSLVFGLAAATMIYAVSEISGAHFNPAVTLAFWAAGRFPKRDVLPYLCAQTTGAFAASGFLRFLFPTHATLGLTAPAGSALQSFVLEVVLTFFLMFLILRATSRSSNIGPLAGLVVGALVVADALFAGPISGNSLNPARSLAPAVVSGHVHDLWIYLAAPTLGALLAVPAYQLLHTDVAPRVITAA